MAEEPVPPLLPKRILTIRLADGCSSADEDDYDDEEEDGVSSQPVGRSGSPAEADDAPGSGIAANLQVNLLLAALGIDAGVRKVVHLF